ALEVGIAGFLRSSPYPKALQHGVIALPDGQRVHQPALRPKVIGAALQRHRRPGTKVPLEHFAIIAHGFDNTRSPSVVQPDELSVAALRAEQAPYHWIITLFHHREIRLRHSA